ncbi:MAG: pyrroloquinoline quinone-dependent dehydrogenase [Proteobacteria bacterium]|nr:pyrroloquinoline quinone-dependent dehydrogenase [Pseudomonadota bacterium]
MQLKSTLTFSIAMLAMLSAGCEKSGPAVELTQGPTADWPAWGGAPGGGHYSPLAQITAENVDSLEIAWVHRSGDMRQGPSMRDEGLDLQTTLPSSSFQATPIVVEKTLYYCTPFNRVFALDPETGAERWMYDPQVNVAQKQLTHCRGVSSWIDPNLAPGKFCRHRIFAPTVDARIIALDGETGRRCDEFSSKGEIDLTIGIGEHGKREYAVTSPPAIVGDTLVTGAFVIDAWDVDVPAGVVRAFDVRTGALKWAWNPVAPGRKQIDAEGNYVRGTTNVWSVISVDKELNHVYVPTGNSSPDYYGGQREGHLDHYSSSVVALDLDTGKVIWHVPTVHHDIWDFDVPAQPTLVDITIDGKKIPALVQVTKMGLTWILDRRDGKAIFGVEERPVPQAGQVAGEYLAATQPFPLKPPPLHPLNFSADDAWGITFWDRNACRDKIEKLDHGPIYTPISAAGTVLYPAPIGGNNWGSPAVDPERGIMVASDTHAAMVATLRPRNACGHSGHEFPQTGTPYCVEIDLLASPLGAPCSPPPWATLAAVDLSSGEKLWQVPLGTLDNNIPVIGRLFKGSPGFGGPLVTKSGLIFISASGDHNLRVFDISNGEELIKFPLPTQAASVPMSYRINESGRQFVVQAVGGHWTGDSVSADHLMAFALKAKPPSVTSTP